jgi:hypothetical protein
MLERRWTTNFRCTPRRYTTRSSVSQRVVETLAHLQTTGKRERERNADLAWCEQWVEETRQLLEHIIRDQAARRRRD